MSFSYIKEGGISSSVSVLTSSAKIMSATTACVYIRCLLIISLLVCVAQAQVKHDSTATSTSSPMLIDLEKFKIRMDQFKSCVDQHLASVVGDVQENRIQPVLTVVGDQVDKFAKVWDIFTEPKNQKKEPEYTSL